jgi:hypothetical protein
VTRGTRPKKPSSSRGFAREARGAWGALGSWGSSGLKTEFFSLFSRREQLPKKYIYLFIYIYLLLLFASALGCIRADGFLPAWTVKSVRRVCWINADARRRPDGKFYRRTSVLISLL